jgi:hypothetical protein
MDLLTYIRNQWDRVGAWTAIGIGALFLLLGWLGVSDTVLPSEQLPYIISGGLGGFFLLGLGAMLWISADLRDEWRKLDDLDRRWAELANPDPAKVAIPQNGAHRVGQEGERSDRKAPAARGDG